MHICLIVDTVIDIVMYQDIPEDVHNKIMEGINRRHLQCTACFKRFRRTHLAKQHVAAAHLKLARWQTFLSIPLGGEGIYM